MKSMLSKLAVAGLLMISAVAGTVSTASAQIAPAGLRPIATVDRPAEPVRAEQVQHRDHYDRRWDRDRRWHRHHDRRDYRDYRRHRDYYGHRRGPSVYFGVAPTYRYVEPRYAAPRYVAPRGRGYASNHVNWCYNQYRSYRASDNTFQPNYGPRRSCHSPFR
ncbi:BA14K family protein [Tianweitania populi]|uniref:Lectin-like protein BA14k n=1 Tax=Tianweitania populi TaxID=1607949 RepID=A0A8J3GK81_9HYPH|nr:BA14K family protein [Tianweitania populi]GHD10697.1 hypothetical protein GCM10016234_12870 [Tianweitania populi]